MRATTRAREEDIVDAVDLARIQFSSTSIYHFLFVPVTIGLSFLVAILHTRWYRSADPGHRRLTRFFGTLLLINVAVGVVTGLVQEFQFGMNWSAYSRFVGDVFGAPLAMEGLAAFFLESTFLGLWIFGWNVLPPRIYLLTIWLMFVGATLSGAFIMAANSWMQHPVGYTTNSRTGRPQLDSIGELFTNEVFLWGYLHVVLASVLTGAMVMLAVSAWQVRRGNPLFNTSHPDPPRHRGAGAGLRTDADGRQSPRSRGDQVPADEDRGGRGAVDDLPAVLVLPVPDRRRKQRPHPDADLPGAAPAVDPRHGQLERPGGRPRRAAVAGCPEVRPRQLRPRRVRAVLVDAGDGVPRQPCVPALAVGRLAGLSPEAGAIKDLPRDCYVGRCDAFHHEHRGMAAHRERPPTLAGARAHEDRGRDLAVSEHRRGRHQPGGLPRRVRPSGSRRRLLDDAVRATRARTGGTAGTRRTDTGRAQDTSADLLGVQEQHHGPSGGLVRRHRRAVDGFLRARGL